MNPNFKDKFVNQYDGFTRSEIKDLLNIDEKDQIFDFFYPQEIIGKDFFDNCNAFKSSLDHNSKIILLTTYLEEKYAIITPTILKFILKELKLNDGIEENEYEELMKFIFGQVTVNLTNEVEKELFMKFLNVETNQKNDLKDKDANDKIKVKENLDEQFPKLPKKKVVEEKSNLNEETIIKDDLLIS